MNDSLQLAAATVRQPRHLLPIGALALVFAGLYTFFDFREGMKDSSLTTTQLATAQGYLKNFGALWLYSNLAFNVVLALLSATLVVMTVAFARDGRTTAACSVGGSALLGSTCFGCPGCYTPVAGSLGLAFFTKSLPLMGVEFKLVSLAITVGAFVWLLRRYSAPQIVRAGA